MSECHGLSIGMSCFSQNFFRSARSIVVDLPAHGRTARTLYYGLVGTYLLHDDREEELELPQGEYDVPLVLADHSFNKDGSFRYAENVDLGFRGDTILVNGAVSPRMKVERRK